MNRPYWRPLRGLGRIGAWVLAAERSQGTSNDPTPAFPKLTMTSMLTAPVARPDGDPIVFVEGGRSLPVVFPRESQRVLGADLSPARKEGEGARRWVMLQPGRSEGLGRKGQEDPHPSRRFIA